MIKIYGTYELTREGLVVFYQITVNHISTILKSLDIFTHGQARRFWY